MRRTLRTALASAIVLGGIAQAGVATSHGALKAQGNKIVDAAGKPIQLAGMSLFWPLWGGEAYFNAGAVSSTVGWGASIVRVPMAVGNGNGSLYTGNTGPIKAAVDAALASDIYVIIDWHVEMDAPQKDKAIAFFTEMSKTYGKKPNVIFEIWNEPAKSSWADIKSYAKDVVGAIRANSDNLVIIGNPEWSKGVAAAASSPFTDYKNIAYTFHFYSCSHGATWRTTVANAAATIPIFFTEWGTTEASGTGAYCPDEATAWLNLAKQYGISWTNWSLSGSGGLSGAISGGGTNGGWNDGNLSTSGKYVKGKIKEVADALGAGGGTGGGDPPTKIDTLAASHIEAEKASSTSTDLQVEATSDVGGGSDLGYSTNGSWAEYTIKVATSGPQTLKARVASEYGGTLTFKLDGAQIGTLQAPNTTGWQIWQTKETPVQIGKTGVAKLRVEWSGSASSLVNLNWIEIVPVSAGVRGGPSGGAEFSARRMGDGLDITLPSGTRELRILDLQGRVLHRQAADLEQNLSIASAPGQIVLVQAATPSGIRTIAVAPVR